MIIMDVTLPPVSPPTSKMVSITITGDPSGIITCIDDNCWIFDIFLSIVIMIIKHHHHHHHNHHVLLLENEWNLSDLEEDDLTALTHMASQE